MMSYDVISDIVYIIYSINICMVNAGSPCKV